MGKTPVKPEGGRRFGGTGKKDERSQRTAPGGSTELAQSENAK